MQPLVVCIDCRPNLKIIELQFHTRFVFFPLYVVMAPILNVTQRFKCTSRINLCKILGVIHLANLTSWICGWVQLISYEFSWRISREISKEITTKTQNLLRNFSSHKHVVKFLNQTYGCLAYKLNLFMHDDITDFFLPLFFTENHLYRSTILT